MNTANYTNPKTQYPVEAIGITCESTFHPSTLSALGFTDSGYAWSNTNEHYHSLETQIGTICVVGLDSVHLVTSVKEEKLDRINSERMLTLFIDMLS